MAEYKAIQTDLLRDWLDGGGDFRLVNVLPKEDYIEQHLPGSFSVPLESEDFLERFAKVVPDRGGRVVVYCHAGNTSRRAAELLTEAGYTDVYNYEGGMDEWEKASYPFEIEKTE